MTLIYTEELVDIGPNGLLALPLDSTSYFPLPAHLYGYAFWHGPSGANHDRFNICSRRLPRAMFDEALEHQYAKFAHAVPSVMGRVDWCSRHACDDYFEAPTAASSLGSGLVLLIFGGVAGPTLLRIIDVPVGRIVFEETSASLCNRLNLVPPPFAKESIDEPVLTASGSGHAYLWLAHTRILLRFEHAKLESRDILKSDRINEAVFSPNFIFHDDWDTAVCQIVPLELDRQRSSYTPTIRKKEYRPLASAAGVDRFAIGHKGGYVEVLNASGSLIDAIRPNPRAPSDDQLHLALSFHGNFLASHSLSGKRVVDIERRLVAAFDISSDVLDCNPFEFSDTVLYRETSMVTDQGIFTLSHGTVAQTKFDDLPWVPVISLLGSARRRTGKTKPPRYRKFLDSWTKPALALKPARAKRESSSFMYGLAMLPAQVSWPKHAGRHMLLLCQINLSDVAALQLDHAYPQDGRLLFFVSANAFGEVAFDEEFNPAAVCVLWLPDSAPEIPEEVIEEGKMLNMSIPWLPCKHIRLMKDRSKLPQPDSSLVAAQQFSDDDLEEYREYFDGKLPDGPSAGNRLGGYPCTVQCNDLEMQAELVLNGEYPKSDANGWATAARWRLLLQLDSDDQVMWGTDSGMLYFMIHDDDLRRHDFSRVVGICAGY